MNEYIDALAHVHVAVIGDLMLDCYLHGEVNRISPEAPVPVMRAIAERPVPGGAANVAANLAALDVHVHLVGLCGQDEAREQLFGCLADAGQVDCRGVVSAADRHTTKKLRIIGERQQIVRNDHENSTPWSAEL